MRALPPLTFSLSRHRFWNAAVGALALLGLASLTAWGLSWRETIGPMRLLGLAALAMTVVVLACALWRRGTMRLVWDGSRWQLGEPPPAVACDCTVALDFGAWMLLRCRSNRTFWLPLERGDLGADWHPLRCTVYSPRPAPVRSDGTERPSRPA